MYKKVRKARVAFFSLSLQVLFETFFALTNTSISRFTGRSMKCLLILFDFNNHYWNGNLKLYYNSYLSNYMNISRTGWLTLSVIINKTPVCADKRISLKPSFTCLQQRWSKCDPSTLAKRPGMSFRKKETKIWNMTNNYFFPNSYKYYSVMRRITDNAAHFSYQNTKRNRISRKINHNVTWLCYL